MFFGVVVNGVFFDSGMVEVWKGNWCLGWNYEVFGGVILLGLDVNYGYV